MIGEIKIMENTKSIETEFARLVQIMGKLRGENGCPWDREQTFESLRQFLLEETYEVLELIDAAEYKKLRYELGDLLLQIVFQSQIAKEKGLFDIEDVIINTIEKEGKKERNKKKQKVKEETEPQTPASGKSPKAAVVKDGLDNTDIQTIKQMIQQYQSGQNGLVQPENLELIELKHALKFFGIDYKMILEHYRKNV